MTVAVGYKLPLAVSALTLAEGVVYLTEFVSWWFRSFHIQGSDVQDPSLADLLGTVSLVWHEVGLVQS